MSDISSSAEATSSAVSGPVNSGAAAGRFIAGRFITANKAGVMGSGRTRLPLHSQLLGISSSSVAPLADQVATTKPEENIYWVDCVVFVFQEVECVLKVFNVFSHYPLQ